MSEQTTTNDNKERQRLYQRCRDDLLKRQLSNTENFDRSILTLSSAALGLSLTFIRSIVPAEDAIFTPLLIIAWVFFVLAIVVTLISFLLSQAGINLQLSHAEKYYIEQKDEYFNRKNLTAYLTEWSAHVSAATFVIAIVCLVIFIAVNFSKEGNQMADNQQPKTNTSIQPGSLVEHGANVPSMEMVPPTQPAAPADPPPAQQPPAGTDGGQGGADSDS